MSGIHTLDVAIAIAIAIAIALAGCSRPGLIAPDASSGTVSLSGGSGGLPLDDLRFSSRLGRVVVPSTSTGNVDLIDAQTLEVTSLGGYARLRNIESADEGDGLIFAADRGALTLGAIDPSTRQLLASIELVSAPDYVRYVSSTSEVWATEPGRARIEIVSVTRTTPPVFAHAAFIDLPGGVEGLAIDAVHGRAYAHIFNNTMAVMDIASRSLVAQWPLGCSSVHGIPVIDSRRGLVFAGCSESRVIILDANGDGRELSRFSAGSTATILGYSSELGHFYLRGDPGTTVSVLGVSATGESTLLGTVESANRGHCMTADDRGNFWVCDSDRGNIVRFHDGFPSSIR